MTYQLLQSYYSGFTYRRFLVDWFNDKLLVIEGNVSDFAPRKTNFGCHSVEDNLSISSVNDNKSQFFWMNIYGNLQSCISINIFVVESLTCHFVHKCWAPRRPLPTTTLFPSYSWCWSSWLHTSQDPELSSDTPSWIPLCRQIRDILSAWKSWSIKTLKHRVVFSDTTDLKAEELMDYYYYYCCC